MMKKDKTTLRLAALARRDQLSPAKRSDLSLKLPTDCLKPFDAFDCSVVAGFWPIKTEIDPRPLMMALKAKGAQLALPAIIDQQTMVFRRYDDENQLIDMGYGTKGPADFSQIIEPTLILAPLAAFDLAGNRIGYGAGYYDRAIALLQQKAKKPMLIGVAFACQQVDAIDFEPHDIPLDMILTERGFLMPKNVINSDL